MSQDAVSEGDNTDGVVVSVVAAKTARTRAGSALRGPVVGHVTPRLSSRDDDDDDDVALLADPEPIATTHHDDLFGSCQLSSTCEDIGKYFGVWEFSAMLTVFWLTISVVGNYLLKGPGDCSIMSTKIIPIDSSL